MLSALSQSRLATPDCRPDWSWPLELATGNAGSVLNLEPATTAYTTMLANQIRRAATTLATQPVPAYTSTAKPMSRAIGRSPIVWTYLPQHLPYHLGLLLQETIVHTRLQAKKHLAEQPASSPVARLNSRDDDNSAVRRLAQTDVLLLLQHTPVYTAGRREKDPIIAAQEADRLGKLGADYISTLRGGQTTYHGPGQLVGYSLMDLEAADVSRQSAARQVHSLAGRPVLT